MVDEAEEYLNTTQRLKQLEDRILALEMLCAPLYGIDIDLLFRQFWHLKVVIIANQAIDTLNRRYDAIIVPPAPPLAGLPDLTGYNNAIAEQNKYTQASSYIANLARTTIGEIKQADNPLEVCRHWYTNTKAHLEKLGIIDVMTETPETTFPIFTKNEA